MGYASLQTKRKCILIEKEDKYCQYIKLKLSGKK
jgi:DNA modification methylase